MSAPECQNHRCRRKLRDDGPSMYYCSYLCSTNGSFAYEVDNRDATCGQSPPPDSDPTNIATRSAKPLTRRANVKEAFDWLDTRATS